jgi:hypothetical protein
MLGIMGEAYSWVGVEARGWEEWFSENGGGKGKGGSRVKIRKESLSQIKRAAKESKLGSFRAAAEGS